MRLGTVEQKVLGSKGDDHRINWGYLLVAAPKSQGTVVMAEDKQARSSFIASGKLPEADDAEMPRAANDRSPVLAVALECGSVGKESVNRHLIIGYDDIYSIELFQQKLRAWWRRAGATAESMLATAERDYATLSKRCDQFDQKLVARARDAGGVEHAALCSWVYRHAIAANKLVASVEGKPLMFPKENFSNGCIGTVDVIFSSAPLFLAYNPKLLEAMIEPIFMYRESGQWTKRIAPHDLGTYPIANGQVYGEDMPVEQCGNMLILTAALTKAQGLPDFAERHWNTLTEWASFLRTNGFDPEDQLCTDDFAGHLARNANLSIKAIMGLGSYAKLADAAHRLSLDKQFMELARNLAGKWIAAANDGDHFRLTFDRKDTWSQKYNLIWDFVLQTHVFPPEVARKEIEFYVNKQNKFGLPLDSRKTYTKSDGIMWSAALSETDRDFLKLIHPVYLFATESPDRVPLSDWHETTDGQVVGFRARSVVGGYFMKMLVEKGK